MDKALDSYHSDLGPTYTGDEMLFLDIAVRTKRFHFRYQTLPTYS